MEEQKFLVPSKLRSKSPTMETCIQPQALGARPMYYCQPMHIIILWQELHKLKHNEMIYT